MELQEFNIREADWSLDGEQLSDVRRQVFVVEQKVPADQDRDERDEKSWHWVATDSGNLPVGTARLLPDGQIGRMAVLSQHRRHGVGTALLRKAVEKAQHLGFGQVYLNAQTHARGFYERDGFQAEGDEFIEADIPHIRMTKALAPPGSP